MFILSTHPDWTPAKRFWSMCGGITEAETLVEGWSEGRSDGEILYLYEVEVRPVMSYRVVNEVRGDVWDGAAL